MVEARGADRATRPGIAVAAMTVALQSSEATQTKPLGIRDCRDSARQSLAT